VEVTNTAVRPQPGCEIIPATRAFTFAFHVTVWYFGIFATLGVHHKGNIQYKVIREHCAQENALTSSEEMTRGLKILRDPRFHNFCHSSVGLHVSRFMKSRNTRWERHVTRKGGRKNVHIIVLPCIRSERKRTVSRTRQSW
jgi:hypothetical protein